MNWIKFKDRSPQHGEEVIVFAPCKCGTDLQIYFRYWEDKQHEYKNWRVTNKTKNYENR